MFNWFRKRAPEVKESPAPKAGMFNTEIEFKPMSPRELQKVVEAKVIQGAVAPTGMGSTMDAIGDGIKPAFNNSALIPEAQLLWYAAQSFIGWQNAAMLAQHWLISKACLMPAKDAVRNGYAITVNDGTVVEPEILDAIRTADVNFSINKNLIEFVQMGRIFGIRVAKFVVESDDPDYYKKPFNIDGVTPGSYRGISQIDPYWITPQLSNSSAENPGAIDFYVPTWWRISGELIHRSHLIIFKTEEVADILKPTYIYGGIPIPQKIYERVYAAERIANEAPMLALTKRTLVFNVDLSKVLANEDKITPRLNSMSYTWNNYGARFIGEEEKVTQLETSLAELDSAIMTQYQIVAAAANVPAVKLLGTTPKGFNSTGEFEEANYHEELKSIQIHDLQPLLQRHHLLLIRSEILPKYGIEFSTSISWNPLDEMTAKELAELNKMKAETDQTLATAGAIDGTDIRQRIISDPESGYDGLSDEISEEILSDPVDG